MRYLAAALVVITVAVGDIIGDLGYMSHADSNNWGGTNTVCLFAFWLLVFWKDDR